MLLLLLRPEMAVVGRRSSNADQRPYPTTVETAYGSGGTPQPGLPDSSTRPISNQSVDCLLRFYIQHSKLCHDVRHNRISISSSTKLGRRLETSDLEMLEALQRLSIT